MGFDPEKNIGPAKRSAKDPWDFSDRYNTKLTDEEERAYQRWAKEEGRAGDVYDYDLRGAWREIMAGTMAEDERKHLGDKYKKPNHPTFSDQSKYNGVDGYVGGSWDKVDGKTRYRASKSNTYTKEQLRRYFDDREKGVILIDER